MDGLGRLQFITYYVYYIFLEFHKQVKPDRQGDRSPELSTVLCAVVIFRVIFSLPRQPTSPTYEMTPVLKPFIVLWRFLHK